MSLYRIFILAAILAAITAPAHAEQISLRMPSYSDGTHEYFIDLLSTALQNTGHEVNIEKVRNLPHLRVRTMLETGEISVLWLLRTDIRDAKFIPIPVKLTNGFIGQRILLISPRQKNDYKDVKDLGAFRRLGKIGGFGKDWFDIGVWDTNFLPYLEMADWRLLFGMIEEGNRGVDYFSRGFNEVVKEAKDHPELIMEPHLMLVYDRDYIFYVSPANPELAPILNDAMEKAMHNGLMGQLMKKHWAHNFDIIKPDSRTIIHLNVPE